MSMHRIGHVLSIPKSNAFFASEPNKKIRILSVDSPNKKYLVEVVEGKLGKWEAPMRYIDSNYKRIKEEM